MDERQVLEQWYSTSKLLFTRELHWIEWILRLGNDVNEKTIRKTESLLEVKKNVRKFFDIFHIFFCLWRVSVVEMKKTILKYEWIYSRT